MVSNGAAASLSVVVNLPIDERPVKRAEEPVAA